MTDDVRIPPPHQITLDALRTRARRVTGFPCRATIGRLRRGRGPRMSISARGVAPGLIETDMTRTITDSAREEWAAKIPLRRLGTPDDVAAAVCFLASDEASYITGQVLAVNGGMYT